MVADEEVGTVTEEEAGVVVEEVAPEVEVLERKRPVSMGNMLNGADLPVPPTPRAPPASSIPTIATTIAAATRTDTASKRARRRVGLPPLLVSIVSQPLRPLEETKESPHQPLEETRLRSSSGRGSTALSPAGRAQRSPGPLGGGAAALAGEAAAPGLSATGSPGPLVSPRHNVQLFPRPSVGKLFPGKGLQIRGFRQSAQLRLQSGLLLLQRGHPGLGLLHPGASLVVGANRTMIRRHCRTYKHKEQDADEHDATTPIGWSLLLGSFRARGPVW